MFKIINENIDDLGVVDNQPVVEKVTRSEIKKEQQNDEMKKLGEILSSYVQLSAEDKRSVLTGLFDDENK